MNYLGAKGGSGVYQAIIGLMPPHDTYIEPFVGSGAILKRKAPAPRSIAIDQSKVCVKGIPFIKGLERYHGDALEWLETLEPFPEWGRTLIYADPPYLHSTRKSAKRYKHEFSDADHERLLASLVRLDGLGVSIILSGYPNALYDDVLPEWGTKEFQCMTRGGVATEKLWFNFDPSLATHWPSFAGQDYIDRQRIKRKAERWAAKYRNMPAIERQAILAAIMAAGEQSSV